MTLRVEATFRRILAADILIRGRYALTGWRSVAALASLISGPCASRTGLAISRRRRFCLNCVALGTRQSAGS